jgi:hypothetical protein
MGTPADSPARPSRSTAAALILLLDGLDRRDGVKLARRLVERVLADGSRSLPDDELDETTFVPSEDPKP